MPPSDAPTPEEKARLRRLLAEARADEPLPEDVARRLDQTLAGLGEERAAGGSEDVVALDHRRRRRTVAGMLAAAAVVIVAGVGINEVLGPGAGDALPSSESADAGSAEADRSAASEEAGSGEAAADDAVTSLDEDDSALLRTEAPLEVRRGPWQPPRIDERRLARDAQRVRRAVPDGVVQREDRAVLYAPDDFTCAPEGWGAGIFVGVRYAGSNAVLALRQPSEQNQVAEVLQCGTGDTLRSVTLPAP